MAKFTPKSVPALSIYGMIPEVDKVILLLEIEIPSSDIIIFIDLLTSS